MGQGLSAHQPKLAAQLGAHHAVLRLPGCFYQFEMTCFYYSVPRFIGYPSCYLGIVLTNRD